MECIFVCIIGFLVCLITFKRNDNKNINENQVCASGGGGGDE